MKKILSLLLLSSFILSSCNIVKNDNDKKATVSKEKMEITVWNLFDPSDVFKWQIQAYQSKYPNVKIKYKKFSNVEEYEQLLINEIAEGEWPDIFAINNNWIDKHIKKIQEFPIWKTTVPMNEQIFKDTFFYTAEQDLIRNNKIYWLPLYIDTLALYYNKSIFRNNIPNSDKPADTWDQIKKQTSMITKGNNSAERFSVAWMAMWRSDNITQFLGILYGIMLNHNVKLFDADLNKAVFSNKSAISPKLWRPYYPFLEALKTYTSFWNNKYKNYSWNKNITLESKKSKEINPFLRWKVWMIFGYSDLYKELIDLRRHMKKLWDVVINENDIGVIEFPQILSFEETGTRTALAEYYPLTVSRNSKNPIASWDFIQYLTSRESLIDYNEKTNKPSSRKDLVEDQMIDPIYWVFARQASFSKSFPKIKLIDTNFLSKVISKAITESISNKITI